MRYNGVYYPREWLEVSTQYLADDFRYALTTKLFNRRLFDQVSFPDELRSLYEAQVVWKLCLAAGTVSFNNYRSYIYTMRSRLDHDSAELLKGEIANLLEEAAVLNDQPITIRDVKRLLVQRLNRFLANAAAYQLSARDVTEYQFLLRKLKN